MDGYLSQPGESGPGDSNPLVCFPFGLALRPGDQGLDELGVLTPPPLPLAAEFIVEFIRELQERCEQLTDARRRHEADVDHSVADVDQLSQQLLPHVEIRQHVFDTS